MVGEHRAPRIFDCGIKRRKVISPIPLSLHSRLKRTRFPVDRKVCRPDRQSCGQQKSTLYLPGVEARLLIHSVLAWLLTLKFSSTIRNFVHIHLKFSSLGSQCLRPLNNRVFLEKSVNIQQFRYVSILRNRWLFVIFKRIRHSTLTWSS